MGKGTDLWDDSALINAFDDAMASYKAVHSKNYHNNSLKEDTHTSDSNKTDPVPTEETSRHIEPEGNGDRAFNSEMETSVPCNNGEGVTEDVTAQENNSDASLHAPESHLHTSSIPYTIEKIDSCSVQQTMDYDQLLRQYYELEEQKQKVAQQLHQASYWNYQTPTQCSTSQDHQVSAYNASEHGLQTPCSLCSCHYLAVPSVLISACPSSGGYGCCIPCMASCSGSQAHPLPGGQRPAESGVCSSGTSLTHGDENALKAGMMAAERAINAMKVEIAASSDACDKKEKGKDKGSPEGNGFQSIISPESDITAVLNAWYMAGFHTGRYLTEQYRRNAHQ